MVELEVVRLRRLRVSALRLRAVARALSDNRSLSDSNGTRGDALLNQGRCAAWRVARTVTGRLRAHPNARYQQDPGVGTLLSNSVIAAAAALTASNRRRAMTEFGIQLKTMARELDDARALTWAADLSDTFGRSQREIRALIEAVYCEVPDCNGAPPVRPARHPAVAASGESPFLTM